MFGLLSKLSSLDAGAESAVRIIAAFDALVEGHVSAAVLTRATSELAECVAGVTLADGTSIRFPNPREDEISRSCRRTSVNLDRGQEVWLEREGASRPLDDLILERFALAARSILFPSKALSTADYADPALTELLISASSAPEDRARAVHLLGLIPSLPLRILAIETISDRDPGAEAVALLARGRRPVRSIRVATIDETAAVVVQSRSSPPIDVKELLEVIAQRQADNGDASNSGLGLRVGIGGPVKPQDARISWLQARLALKFSVAETDSAVVDHETLGSVALLAEVPLDRIAANLDVLALDRLARSDSGELDLRALDMLCRTGSLRHAATALHMHHSSIAARVARAEDRLGWDVATPHGVLRARLALQARQLLANSGYSREVDSPKPRRS